MRAPVREMFFLLKIFYQSKNIDLSLKDRVCEKIWDYETSSLQFSTTHKVKSANSHHFVAYRQKSLITMTYFIFLPHMVAFLVIRGNKKWNKKIKIVPWARQKSCAQGPEPYNLLPRLSNYRLVCSKFGSVNQSRSRKF